MIYCLTIGIDGQNFRQELSLFVNPRLFLSTNLSFPPQSRLPSKDQLLAISEFLEYHVEVKGTRPRR
jgi:hypothetical protein